MMIRVYGGVGAEATSIDVNRSELLALTAFGMVFFDHLHGGVMRAYNGITTGHIAAFCALFREGTPA